MGQENRIIRSLHLLLSSVSRLLSEANMNGGTRQITVNEDRSSG